MLGTLRNVQDELRATQNAKDQTPPGDGQSLIAHPVAEVQAGVAIPATTRHRGETDGTIDLALTGPRPSFTKTPLEKMRSDALAGPVKDAVKDAGKDVGTAPSHGAYDDLRGIAEKPGGAMLDIIT